MSVNKAIILGRLGKDPVLTNLQNGFPICKFSVATSDSWNDKKSGAKQEKTEWHNIIVLGKLAEACGQYLFKGSLCYVEGKLQTRSWDDKNTGQKRYSTEISATYVQFLDSQNKSDGPEKPDDVHSDNSDFGGTDFNGRPLVKNKDIDYDFKNDNIPF